MSRFHNPEFTQIELYVSYKDYNWMMDLTEEMVEKVALDTNGTTKVQVGEHVIDFKRPWKRFTMYEAIEHFTDIDISEMDEAQLRETCKKLNVPTDPSMGRGKLIDELFGEKCEPHLIQPTFITDYPVEMSPLAKKHRDKPGLVERFEGICNGKEFCNAFSELNDPIDQRQRFEAQLELGKRGDEEAMTLDEDFLRALEYGMPPTVGIGIGMDRLAMIMTNSNSIQDVLFFPQMKPEQKKELTVQLEGDAKIVFEMLESHQDADGKMELNRLKELLELSNKKFDKATKELRKQEHIEIYKDEEIVYIKISSGTDNSSSQDSIEILFQDSINLLNWLYKNSWALSDEDMIRTTFDDLSGMAGLSEERFHPAIQLLKEKGYVKIIPDKYPHLNKIEMPKHF